MSGGKEQSLFFLGVPDLRRLCSVTLSLQEDPGEARSTQVKTCRGLALLYCDILASPALDSFTDIMLVMTIDFYKKGIIQAYGHRHNLQLGSPQCVSPGVLQCCLSYSLIARLSPCWNKAGPYLLSGKDFLTETGRLNAVSMQLSTTANQLCISVEASTVRLPPIELEEFELPPVMLKNFFSHHDSVLHTSSMGVAIWCYILPSMKRGQIISVSHQLPSDGPFKTYHDLQNHWHSLYGYCLPDLSVEEEVYCSIYFKMVGERLFTYPLSCIRLQPLQCCPRVDLQGALDTFLSDLRKKLQSVCGLPVSVTTKPCYHTADLTSAASPQTHFQMLEGEPLNLSAKSSVRPVLTQLPAPAARPMRPLFGPQPPSTPLLSRQAAGHGPQDRGGKREGPSSPVDSSSSATCSQLTSMVLCLTPPLSSSLAPPPSPKLVPIFRNRSLARHVNVTQLLAKSHRERGRVALCHGKTNTSAPAPSSSLSFSSSGPSWPSSSSSSSRSTNSSASKRPSQDDLVRLPLPVPRFSLRPKSAEVDSAHQSCDPRKAKHGLSFSPDHMSRPNLNHSFVQRAGLGYECMVPSQSSTPTAPPPLAVEPFDVPSSRVGEKFESKPKRARSAIQDVDVEKMARSNLQEVKLRKGAHRRPAGLSKVNSATLLAWLKGRGVAVRARDKKEELMFRVIGCLAEP